MADSSSIPSKHGPSTAINVHGRRWGRGSRPYLLMLKWLGVCPLLGGMICLLAIELLHAHPTTAAQWQVRTELIRRAFRWVIVPGSFIAITAGILLVVPIWRAMIRMRWFQLKMAIVAVALPALHLLLSGRVRAARWSILVDGDFVAAAAARNTVRVGTAAAVATVLLLIWLGRIKPRLGQDYGRTFAGRKPRE